MNYMTTITAMIANTIRHGGMTMAEYIEREAVERKLADIYMGLGGYKTRDAFYKAIDIVHRYPAADVAPVRHGRWEDNSDFPDTFICSECAAKFDMWKHEQKFFNYCPNCGAKMDF